MNASLQTEQKPTPRRGRPRRLNLEEYQALGAFRHAFRQFLVFSEKGAKQLGLTPQQHQAILAIRAHRGDEPMTIGELAECLVIQNHSAVGLVSRLVDKGLVVRDTSTQDRRRVILWLTPLAEQKLETIARNNLRELNRAADIMEDLLQKLRRMDADGVWSEEGPQDPVAEA